MIGAPDPSSDMAQLMAEFQAREAALKPFRPLDISSPPEVTSLVRTSRLHPSSWEGWTTGGGFIYVRFRHGRLWIGLALTGVSRPRCCSSRTTGAKKGMMASFGSRL
jgi:hypothetical protein